MNILITGCNGQLGNEMQAMASQYALHQYHFTDINVDAQQMGSGLHHFAQLDITNEADIEAFVDTHAIDCIVNCAAYTAVDKAEDNAELAHLLNATAPGYLAKAMGRRGGVMIQVSTDYVFDGTAHTPYTEDLATCPNSVYGRTKLAGEEAVMGACERTFVLRTAWLYSTHGNNFVKTMLRLGHECSELGVIFDQIGTPTYARDLARAIFAVIESGAKVEQTGIYHFSDEGVTSWYDLTVAIHRLAGINTCRVKPLHTAEYPTPASRPHYSVLDKTKIKQTFGIEIPHWEASLAECVSKLMINDK